jgi:hypothetical protein
MAYINQNYLFTLQNEHNAIYWKVYDHIIRTPINEQIEDISLDESQEKLKNTIENCSGDYINVKLFSGKPRKKTAGETSPNEIHVKVKLNSFKENNKSDQSIQGIGFNEYISKIDEIRRLELDKLKMEIEHNQDKEQSKIERILDKLLDNDSFILGLTGVLKQIVSKNQNTPIINQPPINANTGSQDLNNVLNRLNKIDPDLVNTLNDLANFAEKNPDALEQIKPILKT